MSLLNGIMQTIKGNNDMLNTILYTLLALICLLSSMILHYNLGSTTYFNTCQIILWHSLLLGSLINIVLGLISMTNRKQLTKPLRRKGE